MHYFWRNVFGPHKYAAKGVYMNIFAKMSLVGLMSFGLSQAVVNYPFPQMSNYGGNATLLSDKAKASEELKQQFAAWMKDMYNENGDVAGIRSDPGSNQYFSEGVGYGMLLMVYFSDNTTNYQPQFDKLWNFYKKMSNKNGLMIWKIGNLSESWDAGNGAALDGDIDAAAALIMAAYQFGDEKYLSEAKTLIQAMKKYEFEANGLHMPGDAWGDAAYNRKNPGYFDPAYMPLFAQVDTENAAFWSGDAYDKNMALYESSSKEVSTGLIDDWTDKNGKSEDDEYSYDASRAPWRNAKAVCWHGDKRALALDQKMAAFVSTVPASNMKGPVKRSSGALGNDHNSTFVTSLMTSLISDAKYQSKLDEYWKEAVALGNENYFNQSLKLLNGLLVSGNMPNLAAGGQQSTTPVIPTDTTTTNPVIPTDTTANPVNPVDTTGSQNPNMALAPAFASTVSGLRLEGRTLQMSVNGKASVDLVSVTGNVVKKVWNGDAAGSVSVSLQNLPNGVYIVRIQDSKSMTMKKIHLK